MPEFRPACLRSERQECDGLRLWIRTAAAVTEKLLAVVDLVGRVAVTAAAAVVVVHFSH